MTILRPMTPLCELAKKYETDKGGRHMRYGGGDSDTCHEYTPVYWDLLGPRRLQVKHVLEIGVNAGSSLRMWEEFFPNAYIVGLDCRPETLFSAGRIRCYLADQNNRASLEQVMAAEALWDTVASPRTQFDLIVDDGSHEPEHQITSLKVLLPYLAPHGYYIVEDLHNDCHPEIIGDHTPEGFVWHAIPAPNGIGKAHCPCPECGHRGPEQLLVVEHV